MSFIFILFTSFLYSIIIIAPTIFLISNKIFKQNTNFVLALRWAIINELLILSIVTPILVKIKPNVLVIKADTLNDKLINTLYISLASFIYIIPATLVAVLVEKYLFKRNISIKYLGITFCVAFVFIPFIIRILK